MRLPSRTDVGKTLKWLSVPLVSTTLLYVVFLAIAASHFGVHMRARGLVGGYIAELVLGCLLYSVCRRRWAFVLLQALVMGTLLIGNAIMIGFFSVPIRPTDFAALWTLLNQISGWRLALVIAPLAAIALLFVLNFRYRLSSIVPVLVGLCVFWMLPVLFAAPLTRSMDSRFGFSAWGQEQNYRNRGPILYLVNEFARDHMQMGSRPTRHEIAVIIARKRIGTEGNVLAVRQPRNVYVIFMESFWDASLLKSAHFSADTLAPAFRQLWKGDSWAMVPVFGHGSANSEFEALCGMPALGGSIVFVTSIVQHVPCLPRLLGGAGYLTEAFTPDDAGVWDHLTVYRDIGFQRFYAKRSFDMSDRNGEFLSNQSLFAQVSDYSKQDNPEGRPALIYIETTSGHYPYSLNSDRPPIITSTSSNPLVARYANATYYDSQELAAYIANIRVRDPDAVIVAFGDHLPPFGTDPRDYSESGIFPADVGQSTPAQVLRHQSTPLLVINGRAGVVPLGHVSLYELPGIILRLLNTKKPAITALFSPPPGLQMRPADGYLMVLDQSGTPAFCGGQAPGRVCAQARWWWRDVQLLEADMLTGDQYALKITGPLASPAEPKLSYLAAAPVRP